MAIRRHKGWKNGCFWSIKGMTFFRS
jgi:hypothetical protein